jgi:hypothetical protein
MAWLLDNKLVVLQAVSYVVAGASAAALLLAPLTKTKADDKVAGALSKLRNLLLRLGLNQKV